ncbi:putative biofilm stress and motility protein A [Salmonella enterica subsp. enterica]|nr:putative biofilm stress and motility protein A [Salmonella enterica subsp. enterica]
MRRFASLIAALLLSACSVLQGTPQPAPPVADHPQESVAIKRKDYSGWGP